MELAGKVVWLIGASFGIGEELAKQLIAKDVILCISARSEAKLATLAESLGDSCHALPLDVTDHASIIATYKQITATHGTPDIVLYNAGAYDPTSSASFTLEKVEQMIDVNLHGAIRVLHTILPDMKTHRNGTIALVGSVAGYRGLPKAMGYGLSKAALIHLAENLRLDLDGSGIKVCIINPGFVKTRLTDKNSFSMPMMITADKAAAHIAKGLERGHYEIHFPKGFTYMLKLISRLPSQLYFALIRRL